MKSRSFNKAKHLLGSLLLLACIAWLPAVSSAAPPVPVSQPGTWTNVAGQGSDGTSLSGSYTAPAGTDRLMVVVLTGEFSNPVSLSSVAITYDGLPLVEMVNSSPAGEGSMAMFVGYLKEEEIAAASGTTLSASWADNQTASSLNLFAATFANVNQNGGSVVKDVTTNVSAVDAPITFGNDVDYKRLSKVVYLAGYGGTNATTTHASGYTERLVAANFNGSVVTAADKDDTSVNGTATASTSVDFAGTNANHSLVAFALNPVFNPLVHSSVTLGSERWSASGGWGVDGGKYGEFTCYTCHAKNTGNIKRVRNSISFPDSSTMPNGATSAVVSFQKSKGPTSDFGDDSDAHVTSNNICEICHTYDKFQNDGVKFHAFDMSAGGADLTHENGQDCINCHLHSEGFGAGSCDGCHQANGVGHSDATENATLHDAHVNSAYAPDCATCHPHNGSGALHVNNTVNFNNTEISNVYDYPVAGSFGGTCGATNGCHDSDADEWENGDLAFAGDDACQDCHGSSAGFFALLQGWTLAAPAGPTSEEHQVHLSNSNFVAGCTDCHAHSGAMGGQHVDVILQTTVSYNTGDGTCANTCHYVANGRDWTSGTTLDCADCHDADVQGGQANGYYSLDGDGWPPAGGSHPDHVGTGANAGYGVLGNYSTTTDYEFGCGECHGTTASNHMNTVNDIESVTLGYSGGSCSTAACHGHMEHDGVTYVTVVTPVWGGSFVGDRCAGCHSNSPVSAGHEEHQIGFHYDAIYSNKKDFLPVLNSDPLPLGLNTATLGGAIDDAYDTLRGHGGLLQSDESANSTTMSCYVCHNDTVKVKYNDQDPVCGGCHNDTDAPTMGNMVIADKSKHVNGVRDVVFMREKVRSKAQVRDDLFDVPELSNNWTRMNNYKSKFGASYDEQPDTLYNMAALNGGYNPATMTCQISCHLWEDGRVDKYPVHWYENSRHNPDSSKHLMCIDCHTRLPK